MVDRHPAQIAAAENLFVLVARPGEELQLCGGLIAMALGHGRTPVVAVLTDGSGDGADPAAAARRAADRARDSMAGAAVLGLPADRLFRFGLHDATAPLPGTRLFERLVAGIVFLMWSRDCTMIVAPHELARRPDHLAAGGLAAAVAERTRVGLLAYPTGGALPEAVPLPPGQHDDAKRRALAASGCASIAATPETYRLRRALRPSSAV